MAKQTDTIKIHLNLDRGLVIWLRKECERRDIVPSRVVEEALRGIRDVSESPAQAVRRG